MDFFSDSELLDLLRSLTNVTNHGQLSWHRAGKYEFEATVGENHFYLASRDNDGYEPYILIISQNGDEVERVTQEELGDNSSQQLSELYSTAKRKTLGIDRVVKNILDSLKQLEEEPPF
ncbi:hypothetical protein KBX50_24820 [Micromonospora sp. C51]|uniref:hypothetical protein n=1 Tax=Micromonospora sp. C51 TaxID=2824879 RepID=UPI001B394FD1|nr:hypothetical protein [Micromonospora sp. C51]MBQ1051677.1 hypothetical protein [Micromonospora sp. C51]